MKMIAVVAVALGLLTASVAVAQDAPSNAPTANPAQTNPSLQSAPGQDSTLPPDNKAVTGRSVSTGADNRPVTAPNNDAGASTAVGKGR